MSARARLVLVLAVLSLGAGPFAVAYWIHLANSRPQPHGTQREPECLPLKQDLQDIIQSEEDKQLLDSIRKGAPRLESGDIEALEEAEVLSADEARLLKEVEEGKGSQPNNPNEEPKENLPGKRRK